MITVYHFLPDARREPCAHVACRLVGVVRVNGRAPLCLPHASAAIGAPARVTLGHWRVVAP